MDIFSHGLWAGAAAKAVNKKPEILPTANGGGDARRGDSSLSQLAEGGVSSAKHPRKLNVWHAIWWGVFPDLFAFAPAFIGLFWLVATGQMSFADWPGRRGMGEPTAGNDTGAFQLAGHLYNFSHSIFIFAIVFLLVWFFRSRLRQGSGAPKWEMGGWLLHIIMDIPTHSYAFFPTPVFWPLFGWKFNGFQWATPWFLILDYGLLILVYWLLREKKSVSVQEKKSTSVQ